MTCSLLILYVMSIPGKRPCHYYHYCCSWELRPRGSASTARASSATSPTPRAFACGHGSGKTPGIGPSKSQAAKAASCSSCSSCGVSDRAAPTGRLPSRSGPSATRISRATANPALSQSLHQRGVLRVVSSRTLQQARAREAATDAPGLGTKLARFSRRDAPANLAVAPFVDGHLKPALVGVPSPAEQLCCSWPRHLAVDPDRFPQQLQLRLW
eukprot:SAG22_NODE_1202_length_5181_cov_23.099370_2_plen_213_part_00